MAAVRPVVRGRPVGGAGGRVPSPRPGQDGVGLDRRPCPPVRRRGGSNVDGTGGRADQALGRSVGGLGTEIHGGTNGPGRPVTLKVTAGQASGIGPAEALVGDHEPEVVIADSGYDCDAFVVVIAGREGEAVIPSRSSRRQPRARDRHTDKERNGVGRFWAQAKPFRRVATRYEKKAANVLGFVWVAALAVLLK